MAFCKFVQTYKMQRLLLILLMPIFLVIGCKKSVPEGIMAEETMVELMTEVHLVDGYLSTLSIDSSRKVINSLYGHIFNKYQIDSTRFQMNVDYYLGNPTLSKKLYATISDSMTEKETQFRKADSTFQARLNDSIQRIQYFTTLRDQSRKLILNVKLDTLPLSFETSHNDFISRAGLNIQNDLKRINSDKTNIQDSTLKKVGEVGAQDLKSDSLKNKKLVKKSMPKI